VDRKVAGNILALHGPGGGSDSDRISDTYFRLGAWEGWWQHVTSMLRIPTTLRSTSESILERPSRRSLDQGSFSTGLGPSQCVWQPGAGVVLGLAKIDGTHPSTRTPEGHHTFMLSSLSLSDRMGSFSTMAWPEWKHV
jgi:hypothetical protein